MHDVDREIAPCSRYACCRFLDTRLAANSGDSGIDDRCYFVLMQGVAGEDGRTVATVIPADGAADDIHHRFEILDRKRQGWSWHCSTAVGSAISSALHEIRKRRRQSVEHAGDHRIMLIISSMYFRG